MARWTMVISLVMVGLWVTRSYHVQDQRQNTPRGRGRVERPLLPMFNSPRDAPSSRREYRLMTWNLLAPVFASPEKYAFCSPSALNWNTMRCPLILQTIHLHQPDVVCLQEVQIDTWYDDLLPHFQTLNYTCILQNVTRNHPVACAILVKGDEWHVVSVESRSRALIVVLKEDKRHQTTPSFVFLATVHLDARWDQDATRYSQIKSLLKRLEHHQVQLQPQQPTGKPIVIIAGDFNMLRTNPVYQLLATGKCETPATVSSALLPLHDVFSLESQVSSSKTLRRTFAGGSILDYIWFSRSSGLSVQPWIIDERCTKLPNRQKYYSWPAVDQPSDHLPIGMTFSLADNR